MTNRTDKPRAANYRKPPEATRFKPGQSGNPNGRPKGVRNFSTVIEAELNAHIAVTENGKRRKITKRQAVAKQLVNKAVSGDPRALPTLLNEMRHRESLETPESAITILDTTDDALVMANIVRRILEMREPGVPAEPEADDPAGTLAGSEVSAVAGA